MTHITSRTTVELVGRGKLHLSPNDHLATGGEGSAYRKGDTVIKLYSDPQQVQRHSLADKLGLLAKFQHPGIVAPRGLVLDTRGNPIGFYMDHAEGEPLSRVFTNDFRTRTGFGDRQASLLAEGMLEVVTFAHAGGAILADANELNWIANVAKTKAPQPLALDVDSWAIGRWPARVVMPSIRDWHTSGFNQATDHFAWGVVTFQVYTGIHPYKGSLAGYKSGEMERRMKDNASVFAPGVRLNKNVRDFSCIPAPLLGWYEAAFQQGERTPPPSPLATGVTAPSRQVKVARVVTTAQGALRYDRLYDGADPAVRIFPSGVVLLASGRLYDLGKQRIIGAAPSDQCEVVRVDNGWLLGCPGSSGAPPQFTFINATSLENETVPPTIDGTGVVRYRERLFVTTDRGLTEVTVKQFARTLLVTGQTWGAMPNATRWFDGVGIQDAFGATFLITPFDDRACTHVRVRELDGLRPVAARAGHRFVSVIAVNRQGEYRKFQLTFDRNYQTYTVWEGQSDSPELNLALLPNGVAATVVKDGELVIFVPQNGAVNRVTDKDATTDIALANWQDRVVFIRGGQVWSVTMSK